VRGQLIKILIKQLIVLTSSIVFLSYNSVAGAEERLPEDLDLNGSDCISIRTIRDYTTLSRDSLLIRAAGKRSYYVRLSTPRFGTKTSFQMATRSRDNWLCPYGGDSLILDSFTGDESRIRSISRLSPDQLDTILVLFGKKEPGDTEDPAPPELKGAEVEELG
jgi:hypothetical protein